jgi:hypothetical protein
MGRCSAYLTLIKIGAEGALQQVPCLAGSIIRVTARRQASGVIPPERAGGGT